MNKRCTCLFLFLIIVMSSLVGINPVYADEMTVSIAEETCIPMNSYVATTSATSDILPNINTAGGVMTADGCIVLRKNKTAEYDLMVSHAGLYEISVCAGTTANGAGKMCVYDAQGQVLTEGNVQASPSVSETGISEFSYGVEHEIGVISLSEGVNRIKLEYKGKAAYVYEFKLRWAGTNEKIYLSKTDEVRFEAEMFSNGNSNVFVSGSGYAVSLLNDEELSYSLDVADSGVYEIGVCYENGNNSALDIFTSQSNIGRIMLDGSGVSKITDAELDGGKYDITFKLSGSSVNIDYFYAKRLGNRIKILESKNTIEAEFCDENANVEKENFGEITAVDLNSGEEINFTFKEPDGGIYTILLDAQTTSGAKVLVKQNGVEVSTKALTVSELNVFENNVMCNLNLSAGVNVISISLASGQAYIDSIKINKTNSEEASEGNKRKLVSALDFSDSNLETSRIYSSTSATSDYNETKGCLSFTSGAWVSFNVDIEQSGIYMLNMYAGTSSSGNVTISSNKNEDIKGNTTVTNSYTHVVPTEMGMLKLDKGKQTIKFACTGGGMYFFSFSLVKIGGAISLYSISADDVILTSTDISEISRGCDNFKLYFTQDVNADSISEDNISLTTNNKVIPLSVDVDSNMVTVSITEALENDTEYLFEIKGVKDKSTKYTAGDESFVVKTGYTNIGAGSVVIDKAEILYEDIEVCGSALSSTGIGIAGRNIKVFLTTRSNERIQIGSMFSSVDGNFEFEYTLPQGSSEGKYTISLEDEYENEVSADLFYMSKNLETELLGKISHTSTYNEVENIITQYEQELGISVETDMNDVPDNSKVYEHLVGKTYTDMIKLKDAYFLAIVAETINQATSVDTIENLLENHEKCKLIGIDKEKLDLVVNNKNELYGMVFDLEIIPDAAELSEAIYKVLDICLMKEYGKNNVELVVSDKTIYQKQSIEVNVVFSNEIADVSEVIITVQSDDTNFEQSAVCEADGVDVKNIEVKENRVILTLTYAKKFSGKTFGKLVLTPTESKNKYSINLGGEIKYDMGLPYSVKSDVIPTQFDVYVKSSNQPLGGTQSVQSSTHGNTVVKPDKGTPGEIIEEEKEFKFLDLENVEWATESIYTLLKLNIISESEDKKFRPNDNITRAEYIKLVVMAVDAFDKTAETDLKDVTEDKWFYPYVASAQKAKIIMGDGNAFNPDSNITREDMAVIIERALNNAGKNIDIYEGELFADDTDISDYAKTAVYKLYGSSIINGMGSNIYMPKGLATRAQAAKIICEMLKVIGA